MQTPQVSSSACLRPTPCPGFLCPSVDEMQALEKNALNWCPERWDKKCSSRAGAGLSQGQRPSRAPGMGREAVEDAEFTKAAHRGTTQICTSGCLGSHSRTSLLSE